MFAGFLEQLSKQLSKPFVSYTVALLAGAIYPMGLAPLSIWPLLLVSVALLAYLLLSQSHLSASKIGFFYGLGFFGVGASWVHVSIHQFGQAPLVLSIALTALFVAFLALFKALTCWLVARLAKVSTRLSFLLLFPLAWLFADVIQGSLMTGFPWLFLGYGLVESGLEGWLPLIGVYGLTFIAVWLTTLTVYSIDASVNKRHIAPLVFAAAAWFIAFIVANGTANFMGEVQTKPLRVALVQPNIPQEKKWLRSLLPAHIKQYDRMSAAHWSGDLVIWPEAAIPAYQHQIQPWLSKWQQDANVGGAQLILGLPIADFETRQRFASIVTYGRSQQRYDKYHLVPFGEFVPLEGYLRGLIQFFDLPMSSFTAGSDQQAAMLLDDWVVLPAICYEIAYSSLLQRFAADLPEEPFPLIVTISNDAWFGESWGPHQHFQIARARALEFGMPVLRATNTGITAIIDRHGRVVQQLSQFSEGVLAFDGSVEYRATQFTQNGIWILIVMIAGLSVAGFFVTNNLTKGQ